MEAPFAPVVLGLSDTAKLRRDCLYAKAEDAEDAAPRLGSAGSQAVPAQGCGRLSQTEANRKWEVLREARRLSEEEAKRHWTY
jgi:hypothetical protein